MDNDKPEWFDDEDPEVPVQESLPEEEDDEVPDSELEQEVPVDPEVEGTAGLEE